MTVPKPSTRHLRFHTNPPQLAQNCNSFLNCLLMRSSYGNQWIFLAFLRFLVVVGVSSCALAFSLFSSVFSATSSSSSWSKSSGSSSACSSSSFFSVFLFGAGLIARQIPQHDTIGINAVKIAASTRMPIGSSPNFSMTQSFTVSVTGLAFLLVDGTRAFSASWRADQTCSIKSLASFSSKLMRNDPKPILSSMVHRSMERAPIGGKLCGCASSKYCGLSMSLGVHTPL
mmetsp:Transcript_8423/g.31190  ORF Transcript_8423/g.31190 Transcript_8423/m.31190 type:complete len:229 (+) Transcript_8423:196-882(+)